MVDMARKPPTRLESRADSETNKITDRFLIAMLTGILSPYKLQIAIVFLMLIAVTAISLLPPYLVQQAVDGPITAGNLEGLIPYGIVYFASIFIVFVLRFAHTFLLQTIGQNALVNLRQQLFDHILKQDMSFFNTTAVGQLVSRMSNDIEALTELLSTSIVLVASNLVTLVGIIVVMFVINWRLALLSVCVLPVMVIATVYWRRKIRAASNRLHKLVAEMLAYLNEQFNGMLIVQLFGRQKLSQQEFDQINLSYRETHGRMRDAYTLYVSMLQLLTTLGLAIMLYGGSYSVLAQFATVGMLIAFIEYTRRSFDPILQLAEQIAQIQTALSAGERIARMLSIEPELPSPAQPVELSESRHGFAFDHVTFSYEKGHPILRDVDFAVQPGERIAIVGATGAGKTSLAGLLARFYDVDSGRVLIDGVDVRDISTENLRKYVTVVPQNPYCFDGTIADNLRLFDPDVTYEQMAMAATLACAAPFIEKLPDTYNFRLLPGGGNLSQGQRQLLALARALIHNPHSILILDEATSSIDTETEALIQQGLAQVVKERTSLIIAHRLSTVRDADRILVMKRGRIIEQGRHDELLAFGGAYAELYQHHFNEQAEPIN
ncbi:MAG: ABC transporter ATP-binding protein [Anaerolineae bacterium]|nr:ABC transporter ATP-binding protein [Anaerolineae bacterium]